MFLFLMFNLLNIGIKLEEEEIKRMKEQEQEEFLNFILLSRKLQREKELSPHL